MEKQKRRKQWTKRKASEIKRQTWLIHQLQDHLTEVKHGLIARMKRENRGDLRAPLFKAFDPIQDYSNSVLSGIFEDGPQQHDRMDHLLDYGYERIDKAFHEISNLFNKPKYN